MKGTDLPPLNTVYQSYVTNPTKETYEALGEACISVIRLVQAREFGNRFRHLEDTRGEILCRILNNLDQVKPEGNFFNWVYTLTKNVCLDKLRTLGKRKEVGLMENIDGEYEPSYTDSISLHSVIATLTEEEQRICQLKMADCTLEEIAVELGIEPDTLRKRWTRLRDRLRVLLGPLEVD